MSRICEVCGKRPMAGQNIRHQHGGKWERRAPRTKRRFLPNIQTVRVLTEKGTLRKMKVCTKCLKAGKVLRSPAPLPLS